jgi:hypothetical protein
MKWVRSPAWDIFWIWNGLPIGLLLVSLYATQQFEALYILFALGIILETGHLISSAVLAWSNRGFREIMRDSPAQYIALPLLVFALCVSVGAITTMGLTSFRPGLHQMMHVTDWRNPMPILAWVFWLSVGWHFSMQNFGIVRLYRRRWGSTGWRRTDMAICFAITVFAMNGLTILTAPWAVGLSFAPLIAAPWWLFMMGTGIFSWNHWLVAMGLGSGASRRAGLFIAGILLFGLLGFFWKHPTPTYVLVSTAPLLFCTVIGLHSIHYVYDRAVFRFSNPRVRETIGSALSLQGSRTNLLLE